MLQRIPEDTVRDRANDPDTEVILRTAEPRSNSGDFCAVKTHQDEAKDNQNPEKTCNSYHRKRLTFIYKVLVQINEKEITKPEKNGQRT